MSQDVQNKIKKLDYPGTNDRQPLLLNSQRIDSPPPPADRSGTLRDHFFENVAEGIQARDKEHIQTELVRYLSFIWSIISCLCAGSITTFSLYSHLFQTRLHYNQYQVTNITIVIQFALYLPVPLYGYLCDRYGPRWPAVFVAVVFAASYTLAAFAYRSGPPPEAGSGPGNGWPYAIMILAYTGIGLSTSGLYLASVSTCAKNFARSSNKGFALAAPIAAFGLSGMWLSQVGSKLLDERNPDGSHGDIDVFKYFIFLAATLGGVGLIGFFLLRIVDEDQLIDEAVEELERSGLLPESQLFHNQETTTNGYGTLSPVHSHPTTGDELQKALQDQEAQKKIWLLNSETRRFLTDPTMWWLAAGFFLVSGPGDAFITNFGTILGTLYSSPVDAADPSHPAHTSAATHVTIIAVGSTIARLLSGTLSDILAPSASLGQHRRGPASLTTSLHSLEANPNTERQGRFTISRVTLLLSSMLILSIGFVVLASGTVQDHASPRFGIVTGLVGVGYGATFSLTPIIISCVWGAEGFGLHWGLVAMVPSVGGAVWGLIYAAGYSDHAGEDGRCYGTQCYAGAFWGMAVAVWVACAFWLWAWRGPGGWKARGIAV